MEEPLLLMVRRRTTRTRMMIGEQKVADQDQILYYVRDETR